jgi:hypothetical protein
MEVRCHQSNPLWQHDCPHLINWPVIGNYEAIAVSVRVNLMTMLKQQAVEFPVFRWDDFLSELANSICPRERLRV